MSELFSQSGALHPLRPHQQRALEGLRRSLAAGKRRPMLQAPTGFGKTLTAAHIIQRALDKGKRVAFTVPALSLVDQTVTAFEGEGIHAIGVLQGIHPRTDRDQPVQVCSVPTLARRNRLDVDLVIVDEAHELRGEILRWMADRPDVPFIGLSATPWSRGLGKYYDDLIVAATTADLIEQGYLSRFKVFAPSEPDLAGVGTVAGDFNEGQLSEAVDKPALVGDVIATWLARGRDRPTLCYGVNRAHAEHLQQRFLEAGIAAEYIDCFTDRFDRERIFDRFRAGATKVICNVATLAIGIDLPMVSCISDARPTKSEMRFVQTIGRGLRTAPGKDHLLILDHAGNHLRLGLVTDIHDESLDVGEKRKPAAGPKERAKPLPRLCQDCQAVLPHATRVCPECGKVQEARTEIEHLDGELIELGSRRRGAAEASMAEKAAFYGELKWLATVRGYASGWASRNYRERFGVWPNNPWIRTAPAREPSLGTKNWVLSRQIAFAKSRTRAHG